MRLMSYSMADNRSSMIGGVNDGSFNSLYDRNSMSFNSLNNRHHRSFNSLNNGNNRFYSVNTGLDNGSNNGFNNGLIMDTSETLVGYGRRSRVYNRSDFSQNRFLDNGMMFSQKTGSSQSYGNAGKESNLEILENF